MNSYLPLAYNPKFTNSIKIIQSLFRYLRNQNMGIIRVISDRIKLHNLIFLFFLALSLPLPSLAKSISKPNNINTPIFTKIDSRFKYEISYTTNKALVQPSSKYAKRNLLLEVSKLSNDEKIFSLPFDAEINGVLNFCIDSFKVSDFDFDGNNDIRICNPSKPGRYTFYMYQEKKGTFIQDFFYSELIQLSFDSIAQTSEGTLFSGNAKITFKIHGKNSEYIDKIIEKYNDTSNSIRVYHYHRIKDRLALLESSDTIPLIYAPKTYGDYNFDGFVDYAIPVDSNPNIKKYYILNPATKTYQPDTLLNQYTSVSFDDTRKQFKGTIYYVEPRGSNVEAGSTSTTDCYELRGDRFVHLWQMIVIHEATRFSEGNVHYEQYIFIKNKTHNISKYNSIFECDDYNFDGYTDYRLRNNGRKDTYQYFIYDSIASKFKYDTLLSSMETVQYNWVNHSVLGQTHYSKNGVSETKSYKFIDGKFTLYEIFRSIRVDNESEQVIQEYYELQNGKMVLTRTGGVE